MIIIQKYDHPLKCSIRGKKERLSFISNNKIINNAVQVSTNKGPGQTDNIFPIVVPRTDRKIAQ